MGPLRARGGRRLVACLLAALAAAPVGAAHAQIRTDGSVGPARSLVGPNYVIPSGLGRIRGQNLFHSFGEFNIGPGERAVFRHGGAQPIANVIGRVTGGTPSTIEGVLRSRVPNANLFLINPAGVVFGPGASIDVPGSFHAGTAHSVAFADGSRFVADLAKVSSLSASEPVAFGFLGPAAPLVVQGALLRVLPKQTLSLVGGNVDVQGAGLVAPGGRVQLVATDSAGDVHLAPALDTGGFARLGTVQVRDASAVDVTGDPLGDGAGGTVAVRGAVLQVDGFSVITAGTMGSVDGARTGIDLHLTDRIALTGGSQLRSETQGAGRGGDVRLAADQVSADFAAVLTQTIAGDAGDVRIDARHVRLTGSEVTSLNASPAGLGGDVRVVATEAIDVSGGAAVNTVNFSDTGAGGMVVLRAPHVSLDAATVATSTFFGPGGDVLVDAGEFRQTSGAFISGETIFGPAGRLRLVVSGAAEVSGPGTSIFTRSGGPVPAGLIDVDVGSLALTGGAQIQSGLIAGTQAGGVSVRARETVLIAEGSGIASEAFDQDVGPVSITARELILDRGFITTSTVETGRGGDVTIDVDRLTLARGGQIASSSALLATGQGGNIVIDASRSVSISGASPDGVPTTPFSNDPASGLFSTGGIGDAGTITIRAPEISLQDGARLSVAALGTGRAGDILITASERFESRRSQVTTEADVADGGNITFKVGALFYLLDSVVTTSVGGGAGDGGNITVGKGERPGGVPGPLRPLDPDIVALNGSRIRANAFEGAGGRIDIITGVFLNSTSLLTASSRLGVQGTISIQAGVTDVSGSISQLPTEIVEAATLLRASCATRLAESRTSSLVVATRDGVPREPAGLLPSPVRARQPEVAGAGASEFEAGGTLLLAGLFDDRPCRAR